MNKEHFSGLSDERLLQLMMEGDQSAFSRIYRKHWTTLYNAAYKRLKNHDHCYDVLQNIFIDLWTRREKLRIENLLAYLHGAVRFQVYKIAHQEQRHTTFFDSFENLMISPSCDEGTLEKELGELINTWIAALPDKRRRIFKMRYEMDLSTNEIATQLNISQKTVQNQLNTASTELRSKLAGLPAILAFLLSV